MVGVNYYISECEANLYIRVVRVYLKEKKVIGVYKTLKESINAAFKDYKYDFSTDFYKIYVHIKNYNKLNYYVKDVDLEALFPFEYHRSLKTKDLIISKNV